MSNDKKNKKRRGLFQKKPVTKQTDRRDLNNRSNISRDRDNWEIPREVNRKQVERKKPNQRPNGSNVPNNKRSESYEQNKRRLQEQSKKRKSNEDYKKIRVYNQEDLVKSNRKRQLNRSGNKYIFYTYIISFIVLLYFGSNVYRFIAKDGVDSMKLTKVTIDTPKQYDGLIVRDETLYVATTTGEVDYKIANDEKAKAGDLICTIVDATVTEEITNISSEEFVKASQEYNSDVENINDRIKSEFDYGKVTDLSRAYIYAEKIYESMEIRNQIILSKVNSSGGTSVSSAVKESLYTKSSGIINYNIDGFEEVYNVAGIENITEENVKDAIKVSPPVRNKVINAGDNVFKSIRSNTWNIVTFVDNSEIEQRNIQPNKTIEIYVNRTNTYLPISAKVKSITPGDKTSKIVLECYSFMADFAEQRTVSIKLAEENVEGFKIPKTAIKEKDTYAINNDFIFFNESEGYEYVVKEGYNGESYEVPIVKYSKTDVFTYILKENMELTKGDVLVKDGAKYQIPEVSKIYGVYVLNTGVASYREVYPSDGLLEDNSLMFFESRENKNIRMLDNIAVNADEVTENQIVY